jgi:hypothetical protein
MQGLGGGISRDQATRGWRTGSVESLTKLCKSASPYFSLAEKARLSTTRPLGAWSECLPLFVSFGAKDCQHLLTGKQSELSVHSFIACHISATLCFSSMTLLDLTVVENATKDLAGFTLTRLATTPLLLVERGDRRAECAQALNRMQCEIEDAIKVVAKLGETVTAIQQNMKHYAALVANTRVPVLALPVEILAMVFTLAVDNGRHTKTQLLISHVCSKWRTVSLNMPMLWTNIVLGSSSWQSVGAEFLRRSSPLPIRLWIRNPLWKQPQSPLNEELERRLISLRLSVPSYNVPLVLSCLRLAQLRLQEIILDSGTKLEHLHDAVSPIHTLHLRGASAEVFNRDIPAMEHLTELTLGSIDINHVLLALEAIHAAAPALERLHLYSIYLSHEQWSETMLYDGAGYAPVLRSLSMRNCSSSACAAVVDWPLIRLQSFVIEIKYGHERLDIRGRLADFVSVKTVDSMEGLPNRRFTVPRVRRVGVIDDHRMRQDFTRFPQFPSPLHG